ncbi:MAG: hypothetical protein GXO20_03565 [Thermodesulfobacteria bacterium]|nr:hypothetical protein [Thermodesulfobacteriota bacterium]
MATLILKIKPEALEHIKWLLSHLKEEIEVFEVEELEDQALIKAIEEGDKKEFVSEEEIFRFLEG